MIDLDRRSLLKAVAAASALGIIGEGVSPAFADAAVVQGALKLGNPEPFSFDMLKQQARELAGLAYQAPMKPAPEIVNKLNYEEWGKVTFNTDEALFADGPGAFPVTFFHLGMFFAKSVDMLVVTNGQSREIVYDQSMFNIPAGSPANQLPKGIGFAGFRVQEPRNGKLDWRKNDWAAFLGASYFRAIGELFQYGQSARGVAINTAVADRDEEFPDFTKFFIESPPDGGDTTHGLCAPRRPFGDGRLQVPDDAGQSRRHGHRAHAPPAQGRGAPRHRAAHHHVLVFRDREGNRDRLAAGGA